MKFRFPALLITKVLVVFQLLFCTQVAYGLIREDNRMVAYLGNWQPCPSAAQLQQYTHVVIAFAVTYEWTPTQNICNTTCEISVPPVCNDEPNDNLINSLHAAGKKVLVSFGGASMGGSWELDGKPKCWDYCFGREAQVVTRLVEIVNELGVDGVDIDYEYFYEDQQGGSNFANGAAAIKFLSDVTTGLRTSLPAGSYVTHAPMDSDLVAGSAYFNLLTSIGSTNLDFLMPQYYNGITRPSQDGLYCAHHGEVAAAGHYKNVVDSIFAGDATRVVFGFCIHDCSDEKSNTKKSEAASVMTQLHALSSCNGGAFFWVIADDTKGSWSASVNAAMAANKGCSASLVAAAQPKSSVAAAKVTCDSAFSCGTNRWYIFKERKDGTCVQKCVASFRLRWLLKPFWGYQCGFPAVS